MKPGDPIAKLLVERFPPPEWVLGFEVRNSTGFGASRAADAIAMNCYQSKGLEIHGFEVKVARSDWLRELRDGDKAETMAQFCDRWWIVAPAGVVERAELPKTWGLMLVGEDAIRQSVAAPLITRSDALERPFVAAMLRGILTRAIKPSEDELRDARQAGRKEAFAESARARAAAEADARREASDAQKAIDEFEAASGVQIGRWDGGDIGAAVKALRKMGSRHHCALASAERAMRRCLDEVQELRKALDGRAETVV